MKQRRKNVGTGIPPFVSELEAVLDGRRYLGFPLRAGRCRFVKDFFLNSGFVGIEDAMTMEHFSESHTSRFVGAYTSCSMIQFSRLDASCSLRLTFSSRRLISRSRSAILS